MARYTGPVCRLCRRESQKLYLKGDRCFTEKCAIEKRNYAPGQHGQARAKKMSNYGMQLREKQKVRRYYGVLEAHMRKSFQVADKQPGITGENLLRLLELRLDNVVFRLGLAESRAQARQFVTHGHFLVNGKKLDIASYLVKVGDTIEVKDKSKNSPKIKGLQENHQGNVLPWLEFDAEKLSGKVVSEPRREDVDLPIEEHLIVELYSK